MIYCQKWKDLMFFFILSLTFISKPIFVAKPLASTPIIEVTIFFGCMIWIISGKDL